MLGILQMSVEFQVPSPLVPTRESYFVRYCKQNADGSWVVVDVSLDSLRPSSVLKCRRRPSGCLIQEMPNGYSKVCGLYMIDFSSFQIFSVAEGSETSREMCTVFYLKKTDICSTLHCVSGDLGGARRGGRQVGAQHLQTAGELWARLRCTPVGWNAGSPV
jgi:hypothetical protein